MVLFSRLFMYIFLCQVSGFWADNLFSLVKWFVFCVWQNAEFQILGQIEICFNSDFTLMDCERHFTREPISKGDNSTAVNKVSGFLVCDHDTPVYYPPLKSHTSTNWSATHTTTLLLHAQRHTSKCILCVPVNCTVPHMYTLAITYFLSGFTINISLMVIYIKQPRAVSARWKYFWTAWKFSLGQILESNF